MAARTIALAASMLCLGAASLLAQDPAPPGELLDRVVAVVGDSVVLQSDLELALLEMAAQSGRPLPEDPGVLEGLRRQALDQRIEELLLLQAAARDSVAVSDAEVEATVTDYLAQQHQQFGGEAAFERALRGSGTTPEAYRDMIEQQVRASLTIQTYMAQIRQTRTLPPVTEDEIRAYFEEQRSEFGQRPATITIDQVVVAAEPDDASRSAARERAEEALARLREADDFGRVAGQFADDGSARAVAGEPQWFRTSDLAPALADALRAMRPGQLSGVIETHAGFHIVKLERVRGAERQIRHLLIPKPVDDADRERARELAERLVDNIRTGEPIDSLADRYGDPDEQRRIGPSPRDQLPGAYAGALTDVEAGDVVGPITFSGDDGVERWAVVRVSDVTEAGEYTLDDVRSQIRQTLQQQKLIDELIDELRGQTYIDIRM